VLLLPLPLALAASVALGSEPPHAASVTSAAHKAPRNSIFSIVCFPVESQFRVHSLAAMSIGGNLSLVGDVSQNRDSVFLQRVSKNCVVRHENVQKGLQSKAKSVMRVRAPLCFQLLTNLQCVLRVQITTLACSGQ
jgi:hypothetical protein